MARKRQPDFFGIKLPAVPDRAPARKGWTRWQKSTPDHRKWWGPTREANWLKRNFTEHFNEAGELVAEERWGINGESWRMKQPAPGQGPHQGYRAELERAQAAAIELARQRAEERTLREAEAKSGSSAGAWSRA